MLNLRVIPALVWLIIGMWLGNSTPLLSQTFDEDFSIWPADLRISGTIIACGGPIDDAATELLLQRAGGQEAKIIVVQFNSQPLSDDLNELADKTATFEHFRVTTEEPAADDEIRKALGEASGVVLISDSPLGKLPTLFLDSCADELRKLINRKGVICGTGPVSSRLGALKHTTKLEMSMLSPELGLIPDAIIYDNYNDLSDRGQMLSALAARPKCVGIGIPVDASIVLDGRKIRVLGKGKTTFALMANERQPLRLQHVGQASRDNSNPYETIVDLTAWRRDAIERQLPAFPADAAPLPCVENGNLFIVGGGDIPAGMIERMVDLAGGEQAKMVYVPCTERNEVSSDSRMVRQWREMGVRSAVVFHTKNRHQANQDEEFLAPLTEATGIWFGGGRQWNFADSYYGTQAHRLMKDVLKRGGVIGGSSAGASIQADYLARANPVANFDIMAPGYERGLGFLRGVAIDQHFSQRGRQNDMTQLVNRYPQVLGIGIDESTALVVQKSVAEIVGDGKVYFYDRRRPVVPGEPDYVAFGEGTSFDLAQRRPVIAVSEKTPDPIADVLPTIVPKKNLKLIERAVIRLVELQEDDGAWPYEGVYRVRGKIPVGYRVGGTSLACQSLLSAPMSDRSSIREAVTRGIELILQELEHPLMKVSTRDSYDVRVWGHIYALDLFCQLETETGFDDIRQQTRPWIKKLIDIVVEEQHTAGGWNYASQRRHACFVTAPATLALLRAESLGHHVPADVFGRAAKALLGSRNETGSFQYSGPTSARGKADLLPGSIARGAVSETTLLLLGQGSIENVRASIDAFHEHWDELEKRRQKTGTHVPPYGVAPYYFYYGHRYLAQAIQLLPADERKAAFARFEAVLLKTKADDDTWNDRVFERSKAFGTSMSLLALARENDPLPAKLKIVREDDEKN